MNLRRLRKVWIGLVAVVVVAAAAVVTFQVLSSKTRWYGGKPAPLASSPVPPPSTGALLGAWVKPESLTQKGRLRAVVDFEQKLGRRLDVVNTYRRFDENFFNASDESIAAGGSTLMLSWASTDTDEITAGADDDLIRARARELRAFGKPVLLRFRWEMDRPGLRDTVHSGASFIAAWRHVRAVFTAEGATNASWVWCPTAEGYNGGYAQQFYPGDDQVDWVCADVYAGQKLAPIGELSAGFLAFSDKHPSKPAMLGEFGVARSWGDSRRAAWLRDADATFKAHPRIRAVMYFESDANAGFDLAGDPQAFAAFRSLAREPYFNKR
jgi:hypothetical protein